MVADDFFSCDYFALFGLSPSMTVDEAQLEVRYHELQQQAHPDRFVGKSEVERRLAMNLSSRVNDAFATLQSPLSRAAYLLSLAGRDVFSESDTMMAPDFLERQLEWREALAEATTEEQRRTVAADIEAHRRTVVATATEALATGDVDAGYDAVRQWVYMDKLRAESRDGSGTA